MRQRRIRPARAIEIVLAVLDALVVVHAAGIVHRDVKPGNVLLTDDDRVLLSDFGIALIEDVSLTRTGLAMGSLAFMAPEQRICAHSVGPQADVYAVGALLFQLLTGDSPMDLFAEPMDGYRLGPLHPSVREAVFQATRYAPAHRTGSAAEMATLLRTAEVGDWLSNPRPPRGNPVRDLGTTALLTLDRTKVSPGRATMPGVPVPAPAPFGDEGGRLAALTRLAILDTPTEERFDRHTRLAQRLFGLPIALVSLVDRDRQWFKSHMGLDAPETARRVSFCAHAIHSPRKVMVIPDASLDPRFQANPLVTGAPDIRFYAGCPLLAEDGYPIGTFCVIGTEPRDLTEQEEALLRDLAGVVEQELRGDLGDTTDDLTGLSNRKGFALSMRPAMQLFAAATLVHVHLERDVDEDVVRIARMLEQSWPEASIIARVDEREFAVVLAGTDPGHNITDLRAALAGTGIDVTIHRALIDRQLEPPVSVVDRVVIRDTPAKKKKPAPDWQAW